MTPFTQGNCTSQVIFGDRKKIVTVLARVEAEMCFLERTLKKLSRMIENVLYLDKDIGYEDVLCMCKMDQTVHLNSMFHYVNYTSCFKLYFKKELNALKKKNLFI